MLCEYANSAASGKVYIYGHTLISQGNSWYYLYNAHGDVVKYTNATGAVLQSYDYDAFGEEADPSTTDANPFRYAGQYFDDETGTYYLRARYYNPGNGRFTQQDSWGYADPADPLSLNLYVYCYGNPVKYYDPSGNIPVETVFDLIGIGISAYQFFDDPSWGNFGSLLWDVGAFFIPYAPGSYVTKLDDGVDLVRGVTKTAGAAHDVGKATKKSVWAMKAFDRGWEIERRLGGWCNNFPTIDWADMDEAAGLLKNIKSIKSIDLNAKTYQDTSKLYNTLKRYVDKLVDFNGAKYKGINWTVQTGTPRTLEIAIPSSSMTKEQAEIFEKIIEYAQENGVKVIKRIID